MTSETIIEVTKMLIGNTIPVGEAFADNLAFECQNKLIELVNSCIDILISNSSYKDREEYSVEKIGTKAHIELQELYRKIDGYL